jgi:hypothetical protein
MAVISESARARRLIAGAATTALIGIALCAGGEQAIGSYVTVAALLTLIWGVHRFGRSGADAPLFAPRARRASKSES